jgi:putative transcriptional regulator
LNDHCLCFLLHPPQYFHQAVILLLDHDETGSIGVILNRPSDYSLGKLVLSEPLMGQFDSCRLYVGGDVGENRMQMLHSMKELQGNLEQQ